MSQEKQIIKINAKNFWTWFTNPAIYDLDTLMDYLSHKNYKDIKTVGELSKIIDFIDPQFCINFDELANEDELAEQEIAIEDTDKRKIEWII